MRGLGIALMTAAMVAMAGGETIAQQPLLGPPSKRSPGPSALDRIAEVLGLTEMQKAAWDQANKTMRATSAPLFVKARATQREVAALIKQETPDSTALNEKLSTLRALQDQLRKARETMEESQASVLTVEQKQKLDNLRKR